MGPESRGRGAALGLHEPGRLLAWGLEPKTQTHVRGERGTQGCDQGRYGDN